MPKTSLQVFKAKPLPLISVFLFFSFGGDIFSVQNIKIGIFTLRTNKTFFLAHFIVNPINMQYKCRLSGTGFRQFPGRP